MADNINWGKKRKNRAGAGTSGKAKKRIVEKILGRRNANGHIELLLKWKDLPEEESTWEPQSMLGPENIQMLTQFNYQYQRIPPKTANQNPQAAKAPANNKKQKKSKLPPPPAPQKKSVTKEHTYTERVQAVSKKSSDHDSEGNSSESSSSSDSDSSSAGDETSSSDEEPDVVEMKAAAMAKSKQQNIPNMQNNKKMGKSPAPKAFNMPNNLKANERQGLTNFGLAQVRDLLSSDDEDDDETAAVPAAKADQALEGVKQQALSWLKMKTATKETKQQEHGAIDTPSRRRKTGPSDDRSVVQQLDAKNKRRSSMDRGDQSANHFEDEEHKPFDTDEPTEGDVPANFNEFGHWRDHLTASTKCYGIELGLPLEKVLKTFRINGETFVVAKWRNRCAPDAVKLKVLNALYPHLVIEYFENLEMRTVD